MPAVVTHAAADINDSVDRTNYNTPSFTPAAGDLLVVVVRIPGAPPATLPVVTGSTGLTFTRAISSSTTVFVFIANQVAQGIAQTLNVSFGADTAQGLLASVLRVSGMTKTGAAALRQFKDGTGGSGVPPALTFDNPAIDANPTFTGVAGTTNPPNLTPPTNWNEKSDIGIATPVNGLHTSARDSGFSGTTITYGSNAGSTWRGVIFELDNSIPGSASSGMLLINKRRRRMNKL